MSFQDSLFVEEVEYDVTLFAEDAKRKRVLIFPPTNNYRRFLIHQFVQENFGELFNTFSIGQGLARRTVVCYKSDVIRDPTLNGAPSSEQGGAKSSISKMGVERPRSPSASPENSRQRQVKSTPAVEIYRPPAARQPRNVTAMTTEASGSLLTTRIRQRRPDRAVYVPKARRSVDIDETSHSLRDETSPSKSKINRCSKAPLIENQRLLDVCKTSKSKYQDDVNAPAEDLSELLQSDDTPLNKNSITDMFENQEEVPDKVQQVCLATVNKSLQNQDEVLESVSIDISNCVNNEHFECQESNEATTKIKVFHDIVEEHRDKTSVNSHDNNTTKEQKNIPRSFVSDVLIISNSGNDESQTNIVADTVEVMQFKPPEKKPKKVNRTKSKPALPPSSPVKINRDECDWDSLFDDNGECLDPTLIEELTAAVGEVTIEQPKNVYKTFNRTVEVSSDEFAHVVEIYNFPSDFKTSDLAAVFSPFKNGGFELKWVDDTHCLGVFSSPLVAAEVLASDHPFVKTRPLSEATALSRTKARRSAEFLQPYRSRPETCAALARRLVTGALGVKLATARQEREREKVLLREAKERRRLANKQREDAWEGIIAQK